MKKRDLLLGVALLAGYSAQAVSSPYQGSVAGEGVYYLYQVETGKWLESNKKNVEQWTTHGELDDTGIDIELKKPDGFNGYQIWTNYTNNGSLYMTSLSFLPLGLPASHPFWTDAPVDWTSRKAWSGQPFPKDHHWGESEQIRDLF